MSDVFSVDTLRRGLQLGSADRWPDGAHYDVVERWRDTEYVRELGLGCHFLHRQTEIYLWDAYKPRMALALLDLWRNTAPLGLYSICFRQ